MAQAARDHGAQRRRLDWLVEDGEPPGAGAGLEQLRPVGRDEDRRHLDAKLVAQVLWDRLDRGSAPRPLELAQLSLERLLLLGREHLSLLGHPGRLPIGSSPLVCRAIPSLAAVAPDLAPGAPVDTGKRRVALGLLVDECEQQAIRVRQRGLVELAAADSKGAASYGNGFAGNINFFRLDLTGRFGQSSMADQAINQPGNFNVPILATVLSGACENLVNARPAQVAVN